MEDNEKEEPEETESENLRELILQQFANLEQSEGSDDDSYKVRLSCILEDDESESSGPGVGHKDGEKGAKSKKNEKAPPPSAYDSESDAGEVQVTDLDDVKEKTPEESEQNEAFAIKKLKTSDNALKRSFVVRRRELSSDSSDLDISVTNSADGPYSNVNIVEIKEGDDENTLNTGVFVESEASADENLEKARCSGVGEGGLEVVDNKTLAPIFAKVSRTYLEKTKSNVKWEENEKIDKIFRKFMEEEVKKRELQQSIFSLQDVCIRGLSPREYNPPVPPETYLWEELKKMRERGGYPWTYLDKPPFDEATWKKYMEHVYEPINPSPLPKDQQQETFRQPEPQQQQPLCSSIPEPDKKIIRISSKTSFSKSAVEDSRTSEEFLSEEAQEIQGRLESYFVDPTPATTSKTDVISTVPSEFEDLPAKQGNLVKTRREQMRAQAAEIQQRLRNHAGRIRNKFSNMPKPSLGRKDRLKRQTTEKPRFKFPEMHAPKISLPDRSKFKFPEKTKFHFPEYRFHFPNKSKFNLPERSKFSSMAERAKIHLPDRGKLQLLDKSKLRLPEKTRFHLPIRSKFHCPEKAKLQLPNRLEILKFRKLSGSVETSPIGRFDFDLKSYPKLFTKHSKDYMTSSPKQTRGRTPPPRMKQREQQQAKWMDDELKYADDDLDEENSTKSDFEKSYMEYFGKIPTISTKSSTSRFLEPSDDHKKGVLEEINPDEFFLRQKGISQDDIDMGQYLSREIREAFRSPDINALAKINYDENVEPKRPNRAESRKKKSILDKAYKSDQRISDDGYKTYPPRRPGRKSRSHSKSLINEEAIIADLYDNDSANLSRYDNVEYDEEKSEYYKTPKPARQYQHYKVPKPHAPVCSRSSINRETAEEKEGSNKRIHENWEDLSEPRKPVRRKNKKIEEKQQGKKLETIALESYTEEVLQESPVPPKRIRTRSLGSRSLRPLAADSDANRSLPSGSIDVLKDDNQQQIQHVSLEFLPRAHIYEITDLDDPGFGYATVGKPTMTKPERQRKKPNRPPPPRRKKEVSIPAYNTYPRRIPLRPSRNYSTLGPSRPPRQKKVPPTEKTLAERQSQAYAEEQSLLRESPDSSKDLQTEKVIKKMKGRPLPPPPRPPRQKSKSPECELELMDEEELSLSTSKNEEFFLERKVTAFVHEPPLEREMVNQDVQSLQTDSLPEDFFFNTEKANGMREFNHEQLKIQQAFLEEMKKEKEELQRKNVDENDLVDEELKAEVIRQIEDIIAEEKRILERKNEERIRRETSELESGEPGKSKSFLDVDEDMGYASLGRPRHRQEPPPLQELFAKMDKLQVKELEVETLNVREVQSDQIFVKELQSNRISSPDFDNRGGTIAAGNIDLPPSFIDQIVAKIPWDTLKQSKKLIFRSEAMQVPSVRPQRRQRGTQVQEDSDDEDFQPRRPHRKHHQLQYSSEEGEEERRFSERADDGRQTREVEGIPELSLQLVRACTSAGVQALRSFAQANAFVARSVDRELCVQAILCITIALVAGFFLFGFDAKIVHLHRWDFQFPPQPPSGRY